MMFGQAFHQDLAWTSASLKPVWNWEPIIRREHIPPQLDMLQRHRHMVENLEVGGFAGLQGALLSHFTSLVQLTVTNSIDISGLVHLPSSIKRATFLHCQFKRSCLKELQEFDVKHTTACIQLVHCSDAISLRKLGSRDENRELYISVTVDCGVWNPNPTTIPGWNPAASE
eukprot:NODE_3755_length_735_cov_54.725948_g3158_i0.p1 GENE.NODE_3755_length_735_cov_54.725948_g3158_i0~~NODE_3755_length_735_cov_54.725948_g3158_i0.p1  ORF type:complete len:171 (+),score=42.54 NODE_3755_length_735_cov_54.725948_g3158_i0:143-655(+)